MIHLKNCQRLKAVKDGSYKQITDIGEARDLLTRMLRYGLMVELHAAETKILSKFKALRQEQDIKFLLEATDISVASRVFALGNYGISSGDGCMFLNKVLNTDPAQIPDLFKKLELVF